MVVQYFAGPWIKFYLYTINMHRDKSLAVDEKTCCHFNADGLN